MIKILTLFFIPLLFISCSFKEEPNAWQYKSANYFSLYTKNFLQGNKVLAENNLKRAVSSAKKSANFTTLARVYLGKCALNISIGVHDDCQEYRNISDIVSSQKLDAYYAFIIKDINEQQITLLPKEYKHFAKYLKESKFTEAQRELFRMRKVSSKILAASLIHETLDINAINKMLDLTSFYGYKRAVLFWLIESKKKTKDKQKRQKIDKKIEILTKVEI